MGTPEILQACLGTNVRRQVNHVAERIYKQTRQHVFFAGTGSSCYTGLAQAYALQGIADIPASAHITSEVGAYPRHVLGPRSVWIVTSHSGRTPGDLLTVELARERSAYAVGITEIPESRLAQSVDDTIVGPGGPKAGMPATCTCNAVMFRLSELGIALARKAGPGDTADHFQARPRHVRASLHAFLVTFASRAPDFVAAVAIRSAFFLIRGGPNMARSHEGALALLQATGVTAQAFQMEELFYGRVQALTAGIWRVAFAARGPLHDRIAQGAQATRIIGAQVLTIAPRDPKALDDADLGIGMPAVVPEGLTSLLYIAPLWQIGYHFSLAPRRDPDRL